MAYGKVRIDQIQSTTRTVNVDDLTLDSDLGTAAALNAGTASGNVPVLDGAGKIVSSVLPSYVDDVVEYANLAAFPATGETGKIYVAIDTNKTYRWSGSAYIEISSSPVTSVAGRTGVVTLSNTDISGLGTAATTAATDYAPAAQGVTNGNSHDHNGGDGAQIAYSSLSGLPTLGTAAAKNTGTASGNVVELDGSARLPAVDGSQLTGINTAGTDLTYTASTRLLASSTGTDATLPLFSSTDAGLAPASSGGTTNFLRADGTFAAPPGGTPGGSTTQVQFNNAGAFGGDVDLTWNSTTNVLTVGGDVNLNDGGAFSTTLQTITPTANRTVSIPNATGTLAFVAGSSGQTLYNLSGALAGSSTTFDATTGTRFVVPFGYGAGAGGTVTQATNKATGATLNTRCGQVTLNGAALAADTTVSFVLTNSQVAAGDVLILNHISAGTAGSYLLNARSAAGSATIDVRNITAGSLSEAIVIAFAVIKATTA